MITFEQAVKRINDLKTDDAYQVEKLNDFQYRINGNLDIYINSKPKEKTAVSSNFKAKIDGKKAELQSIATKINNRQEHRHIECVVKMNFPKPTRKTLTRLDTAEVVWEKPMTSEEMQLKLSLENEENLNGSMVVHNNPLKD